MVCLYIATHNKTGLKYFGRTSRFFTNEDLQSSYHGSGKYWLNHLSKYGNDVKMEVYGIYKISEVKKVAELFSKQNNIVISNEWANLTIEDGKHLFDDGFKHSELSKKKMSKKAKGRKLDISVKTQISKTLKENFDCTKHNTSLHIDIYNKDGELIYETFGDIKKIIEKYNLPKTLIKSYRNNGEPILLKAQKVKIKKACQEQYIGWYAKIRK